MRLLLLNWRDIKHPSSGGAEKTTFKLLSYLASKRWKITWFSSHLPQLPHHEEINQIKFIREGSLRTVHLKFFLRYQKEFRGKYDLIIDQINTIPFFTPLYIKEKKVAFIHQLARKIWFYEAPFYIAPWGYLLEPLYLKIYRNIPTLTVSCSTKEDLKKLGFKKIFVINNASELKPLKQIPSKEKIPTFIYLGRITPSKRIEDQLKALSLLNFDFRFWIVGEGREKYKAKLKKLIKTLKLDKRVKFWGWVSLEKKKELLQKAWALLLTSVREGYGLVVLEAASQGTPTFGYSVPGLKDSIKDTEGILINKSHFRELANVLIQFVSDIKWKRFLFEKVLKNSRKYSWQESGKSFEKLILSL